MRHVGREEATRLLHDSRPGASVHEVTAGGARPDLADPVRAGQNVPEVHEFDYADGGAYAWSWTAPQMIPAGSRLWCTAPGGEEVFCVRAETVLPQPEVLRVRPGTLQVLRSRFATPQPSLVDASVIAPADLTQGTGLTEDEALLVLRSHHARLTRTGRAWIGGSLTALPVVGNAINLGGALDSPVLLGVAAAIGLGPVVVASTAYLGPGRRRRRRVSQAYAEGFLEPVDLTEQRPVGVTVTTHDGRRWSWEVRPESRARLRAGSRVWATPVREGGYVHLVGMGDGDGPPIAVEARTVATTPRPPRTEIQDVVRR